MTFLSTFTRRFKEIAASANVRKPIAPAGKPALKPVGIEPAKGGQVAANAKPDLAKAPLDKPPVISNELPPITHRRTSQAGVKLLHDFEGLHRVRPDGMVESYLCPANVWTIGWGATGADPFNGGNIRKGTVWTRAQCDLRFEQHLAQFEAGVREGIGKAATSQAQFDAMVCLAYNIGVAAFRRSTVLRRHVAGDFPGAAKAFLMWNKANGKILRGLTRRREAEAKLYGGGA